MELKKVVIVEDDLDQVKALNVRLISRGYVAAIAMNAVSALTVIENERPDLILLDLGLPGGDGYSVLEKLRGKPDLASIPVIVVTSRTELRDKVRSFDAGVRYYFEKPFDSEDLLAVIESVLKTSAGPA